MLKFHSLKVAQVAPDAEDAVAIALEVPAELRDEYHGSAGQHVVVRVAIEGEETRRTYSLVNAPGEWPLRIVPRVHALGRMSRHLAEQLRPGTCWTFCRQTAASHRAILPPLPGPMWRLRPAVASRRCLPVVRTLLARGAQRVILFYGNSGTARAMCLEELLALKDRYIERLSLHS